MDTKTSINTMELILNEKYLIKPSMTIEEIKNSNLIEIMDEKSKISVEKNLQYPLCIKHVIDGAEVIVRLDIVKERLKSIYITIDQERSSENCNNDVNKGSYGWLGNIQIPEIEGINEVEHKKVQELCKIYGKFPNEDDLSESIKHLQDKIREINHQINTFTQEKTNLEKVKNTVKALEEVYTKYELSGFDENVLNENMDNIAKYEKTKEMLKATDIKNELELRKRIESNKNNVEKLEQIRTNLNMESNQISDSYSAYQKYKEIGTRKLDQLKKEFICNLRAKDELKSIFAYDGDKITHYFYKEKVKLVNANIENLDNEINVIGVIDEDRTDDKIEYLRQKLRNEERYLKENHPLNDSNKENEIKKIVKSIMEDINSNMYNDLNAINELYSIENRIVEIQNKIELKKYLIESQKELKVLKGAKEKLEVLHKYEPIMVTKEKHKDNELFKNSYEKKYEKEIKEYNQVQNDLASMKINNWDDYNKAKSIYDDKEQKLLKLKNISEVTNLDNTKEFEKIVKYKNKRDEIIKKNSNLVDIDIDENSYLDDKAQEIGVDENLLNENENENNTNSNKETNKTLKVIENKNKTKQGKEIKDTRNNTTNTGQVRNNSNAVGKSLNNNLESKNKRPKKTLEQLKKELICNLKAKNELKVIIEYSSNKEMQAFCEEKMKEMNIAIRNLDNEISLLGVRGKSEIDDKIDYMKEKFVYMEKHNVVDKKRDLAEHNSFIENKVKEITKNAMVELDPNIADKLRDINELYNIENKMAEVEKEINLKQQIIELEEEGRRLEKAREKLDIVGKYSYTVECLTNSFYGNIYKKAMGTQVEAYNQAQEYLNEMGISNNRQYKKAKKIYDDKKKRMLADKNVSQLENLDTAKGLKKIVDYKSSQNEIIKKYRTT
ncbi:hypothetical protein [Clostridium sp. JS66]|uniref:hypothetical protein n=1 Tax=Clostridium sp. JS66 TaxID=3064705 RepID=UPI00298DBC56|nr:hypothetical protein [Clostridium sp. JS66]WPC40167.1 hypothetical protein Q6H37_19980 [Clostridium sp. JS66]